MECLFHLSFISRWRCWLLQVASGGEAATQPETEHHTQEYPTSLVQHHRHCVSVIHCSQDSDVCREAPPKPVCVWLGCRKDNPVLERRQYHSEDSPFNSQHRFGDFGDCQIVAFPKSCHGTNHRCLWQRHLLQKKTVYSIWLISDFDSKFRNQAIEFKALSWFLVLVSLNQE